MADERTIEITNFCPFGCGFCSTDATASRNSAIFLPFATVAQEIHQAREDGVKFLHISGGEPAFHPKIGEILYGCRNVFGGNYMLHSNLIPQIAYNARVLDGIRVHAYLTPADVDEVHVLKRINQGREAKQPEVHCSRNWREQCSCDHIVVRPDGT
ncbi:hypothetical protein LCGC14_2631540, partial [marine sediment metagenome]